MKKPRFRSLTCKKRGKGEGLVNSLINNLPFEAHLVGYNYCGPGTKLEKRLARGDVGINPLDEACKEHDIAYNTYKDLERRRAADLVLLQKAIERINAADTPFGEKSAAYLIKLIMKLKRKMGAGIKKKKGGFLFPLLTTALTAFKTYKDFKNAKKMLSDQQTHNRIMEEIARKGKGFYLNPYQGEGSKRRKKRGAGAKKKNAQEGKKWSDYEYTALSHGSQYT